MSEPHAPKHPNRTVATRRLVRTAGWVLGFPVALAGVLVLLVWGLLYFRKDAVQQEAVARVNAQLNAPLAVGGVELDLWSQFPDVSLRLERVFCKDVLPAGSQDTLFYVPSVYVQFAAWDLLMGRTTVKRLTLQGGRVEIRQYADGTGNYRFWKSTDGPNPQVDLRGVRLENVRLRMEYPGLELESRVHQLRLRGNLHPEGFAARLETELELPRPNPTRDRPTWTLSAALDLAQNDERLEWNGGEIRWEDWVLRTSGSAQPNDLRWKANAENLDLAALGNLLPPAWLPDPQTVQATGALDLSVRGRTVPAGSRVQAAAQVRDAQINLPSNGWTLNQTNGTVTWDNGPGGTWKDAALEARFTADATDGIVRLTNFDAPTLEAELNVHLPLATALAWGGFRVVESANGEVRGNVRITQSYPSLTALSEKALDGATVTGNLILGRGSAKLYGTGATLEQLEARVTLQSPNALLDAVTFRVGKSDLRLTGTAQNSLDWGGTAPLFFDVDLSSRQLFVEDVLAWAVWNAEEPPLPNQTPEPESPWDYRLRLHAQNLAHQTFFATEATGTLWSTGERLDGVDFKLRASDGVLTGGFSWEPDGSGSVVLCNVKAQNVRLSSFLRSWDNFGQSELTHEHLDGKADLTVSCRVPLNANNDADPQSIQAVVDFTVREGRLRNYAPLQALSKYAQAQALEDLRFGTLQNTLTVAQGVLTVPPMTVENNALTLKLFGTHAFNGTVDYTVQFRLKEALNAKKTQRPSELNAFLAESDDPGNVWIPVRIYGPQDAPTITLDTKAAARGSLQTVQSDFKRQGSELRQLLKPAPAAQPAAEKYIFEWEETRDTNRMP